MTHFVVPVPEGERAQLRFARRCLGCAAPTTETLTLTAGHHGPARPLRWEQPVPLCPTCQAAHARASRQAAAGRRITAAAALTTGVAATAAAVTVGLSDPPALLLGVGCAALLGFPLASWLSARALAGQRVDLYCFRDPRRAEGVTFVCLRIDHDDAAADFASRNARATPMARWEQGSR
ncbi:MAG: hypothetical protein CMH57_10100 [Myxococcales bacterium]|nr:hypothetical protein [Myxococcales bacterium]